MAGKSPVLASATEGTGVGEQAADPLLDVTGDLAGRPVGVEHQVAGWFGAGQGLEAGPDPEVEVGGLGLEAVAAERVRRLSPAIGSISSKIVRSGMRPPVAPPVEPGDLVDRRFRPAPW